MKFYHLKTSATLLLFILTFVACSSLTTNVYRVSKTSHVTATTALKAWNDFLKTHDVSVKQELAVQDAYDKYRVTQQALLNSAIFYSTNSGGLSQQSMDKVISDSSFALNELLNLLTSYGVKFTE